MLRINPIKTIAFATALSAVTASSAQKRLQSSDSKYVNIELKKSDNSTNDSFVYQTEPNANSTVSDKNIKQKNKKNRYVDIEFKPAETMEEAIKFAKKKFGADLYLEDNLVAANFVNELFTNVENKMKGTGVLPTRVVFNRKLRSYAGYLNYDDQRIFCFGPEFIREFETAQAKGKSFMYVLEEMGKKNPSQAEYRIRTVYHEIGHANHYENCKNKTSNINSREKFNKDIENNDVIQKFHRKYALTSPAEFVADTFAYKIMGKEIPKEVDELYDKYGGMPVPE